MAFLILEDCIKCSIAYTQDNQMLAWALVAIAFGLLAAVFILKKK